MEKQIFSNLSIAEKAKLTKEKGTFLEMEDYYSYQILKYTLDGERVDIVCDYSNEIVSVEFTEKKDNYLSDQFDSQLGAPI